MEHGRDKFRKLDGGRSVASADNPEPFVGDPHQQGLNQMGDDGNVSEGRRNRSLYFSLRRRDLSASQTSSPLYKVGVADPDSPPAPSPARETLHRTCNLETDMGGKTFVFLPHSGWIVGVGGDPGATIIFDTKTDRVIRGPELVSKKWRPVVAVVGGSKIYALAATPDYLEDPDFPPWFEVLDLSGDPAVTEAADGTLRLDEAACSWKALPCPACFPDRLCPMEFRGAPFITVRSSAVVGRYILVSLNQPSYCVFAFDTVSGKWHKIAGEYLSFVGAATLREHGGDIFLAFSHKDGPIKAYRICVSAATSRQPSDEEGCGNNIELSITAITVRDKEHFEAGLGGGCCLISLDREHFSVLFWYEGRGRYLVYDKETEETYPRKLYLKLVTYRTESPVLEGKTPEIVISSQREQTFKVCSSLGFDSAPIAFALSI
ncbi:unnamed protein product [Urochloa decumbens]|uniref:Uncharacterized protein n=1 Tax=Urochloa decumbens TaxID=240449 RepID=A0ABC9D1P7_9POAL